VNDGMSGLAQRHCVPGARKLSPVDVDAALAVLRGWERIDDHLVKTFSFPEFHAVMAFVNAVAYVAHREDHHPDLAVGFNRVTVSYSTHDAGGITLNDCICAARIDALDP
jgi:4a-hydroxytetrahydrobiopterin dehydratase